MSQKYDIEVLESAEELQKIMNEQNKQVNKKKIQLLYLYKTNQVTNIKDVAEILDKDRSTVYRWLKIYRERGIGGLLERKPGQGRPQRIPPPVVEDLKSLLIDRNHGFTNYNNILNWLANKHNIKVDYKTIYSLINYTLKIRVIWSKDAHCKDESE